MRGAKCSRAQGSGIPPCNFAVRSDTYWPKTPSTFALVASQVEEAVVNYLEDIINTDNQYCFEAVHKCINECSEVAAFRSHNLQFIWGT